jgi:hypothetical protein
LWIGEIAFAAADFPVFAQTQQDWESCKATEADRLSLDQQIKGCTALACRNRSAGRRSRRRIQLSRLQLPRQSRVRVRDPGLEYSRAIKLMPDADAYSNRGADYNNLGRYDLAIRSIRSAAEACRSQTIQN